MAREQTGTAVVTGGAREIAPATGKLGVMLVGLGAVSTTFIAGVENVRRGRALPIGSLSQMATIRLGKRTEKSVPKIKKSAKLDRIVIVWCASTEVFLTPGPAHQTLAAFEKAMEQNDQTIAPSILYAYAALMESIPFANGAPNLTVDLPVMEKLAEERHVPIGGKDFKTGQTMMKSVLAPAFKARMLGLSGWYSTNILGNRDGEVLDDPESFKTKEESKLGLLEHILQPELYPELYGKVYHKVRINYYPPRGDNKEGWDNIDIFGWLGYPMQIKVDFLCRDSLLAAPIVLDLVLFLDLAQRARLSG